MGMSASQARYLALTERKNDIEYQGQQINQQRTTLSDQVNALYNSLLVMSVPTPPSTQDYTKVVYSGVDGASTFTIGNVVPHGTTYSIDLSYKKTGHGLTSTGTATAKKTESKIKVSKIENTWIDEVPAKPKTITATSMGNKIVDNDTRILHKVSNDEKAQINDTDEVFVRNKDGKFEATTKKEAGGEDYYILTTAQNDENNKPNNYNTETDYIYESGEAATNGEDAHGTLCPNWNQKYVLENNQLRKTTAADFNNVNGQYYYKEGITYMDLDENGKEYNNPDYKGHSYQVAGNTCYTLDEAYQDNYFTSLDEYNSIKEAITNTYPDKAPDDFLVYFTVENGSGTLIPHFVAKESFSVLDKNSNGTSQVKFDNYIANGTYTAVQNVDGCKLTFDNDGRITEIEIPRYNEKGELTG